VEAFNVEVNRKIAALEDVALAKLDQPDLAEDVVRYVFPLPDSYVVNVESVARHPQAVHAGTLLEQGGVETRFFISRNFLSDQLEPSAVVFSCICDDQPSPTIRGLQFAAPTELPLPPTPNVYDRRKRHELSPAERNVYLAALALAAYVHEDARPQDKYTPQPIPAEALSSCSDEDLRAYLQWCQAHTYRYDLAEDALAAEVAEPFLHAANVALADGALHRRTFLSRGDSLQRCVALEAQDLDGPPAHIDHQQQSEPRLKISVVEDGVEYIYERDRFGHVEVKLRGADELERYSQLQSYRLLRDEDGAVTGFEFDTDELEAIEAAERAAGLFRPTMHELDFFLERVHEV